MRGERDEIEKCRFKAGGVCQRQNPRERRRISGFVGTIVPLERPGYELLTRA